MLFVGIAANTTEPMLIGFVFLGLALFSWFNLAVNSPSKPRKDRPVKKNAAQLAREAELEAEKRQRELAHRTRKEAYLANPVPLQIRQWNKTFLWDWNFKRKSLDQTLYIRQTSNGDLDFNKTSYKYMDCCMIHQQGGVWYLRNVGSNTQIRMNSAAAREKCAGMRVNTQEFTVPRNTALELLPGDSFVVIQGSTVCYFRIDERAAV